MRICLECTTRISKLSNYKENCFPFAIRMCLWCTTRIRNLSNYKTEYFSWAWWRGLRYCCQCLVFYEQSKVPLLLLILLPTILLSLLLLYYYLLLLLLPLETFFGHQKTTFEQFAVTTIPNPHHHPKISNSLALSKVCSPFGT